MCDFPSVTLESSILTSKSYFLKLSPAKAVWFTRPPGTFAIFSLKS